MDSWGIWVGTKVDELCVAVCVTPQRVLHTVRVYQELHRGRVPIKVERATGAEVHSLTPCGYCGREHVEWCATDSNGEPAPVEVEVA